ncbi:MAG: XisI protein [Deltaproteobacteria bacterium]|nr:XisI protein [Deltaproteobacteria bacterium]
MERLRTKKIHIEYDGIEHEITDDLIRRGIPKDRIVLSFLPEMAA